MSQKWFTLKFYLSSSLKVFKIDMNLFGGDFNPQISSRDQDSIRLFNNLINIVTARLTFNFWNDRNIFSRFIQTVSNLSNSFSISNEGSEDHVDVLFNPELKVQLVLLGDRRQVRVQPWQVTAFAGSQISAVFDFTNHIAVS